MKLLTHNQWKADVLGRYVDVDGWYGGQCWDAFADYCIRVLGIQPINTHGGNWSGWAYAIWDQYETNGAKPHFAKIGPDQPAQNGDIAIWAEEPSYYPASHIAPVDADAGENLVCLSQNSSVARPDLPGYHPDATGPIIRQVLTKKGLAGYLRFRSNIMPAGAITNKEGFLMALSDKQQQELYTMIKETRDRTLGGIPAGPARTPEQIGGSRPPRLADSGDVWDILTRLAKVLDTSGGNVLLNAIAEASGKTITEVTKNAQAIADVDRQYIPDRTSDLVTGEEK